MNNLGTKFNTSSPRYSSTKNCGGISPQENALTYKKKVFFATDIDSPLILGEVYFIENSIVYDDINFYPGDVIVWNGDSFDFLNYSYDRIVTENFTDYINSTSNLHFNFIIVDDNNNIIYI